MQAGAVKTDLGDGYLSIDSASEKPAYLNRKAGENRFCGNGVADNKLFGLAERSIDRHGFACRIDEPDERNAILEKFSNLSSELSQAVGWGQYLNCEIR